MSAVEATDIVGPFNRDRAYSESLAIQNKYGKVILEHQQIALTHPSGCPEAERITMGIGSIRRGEKSSDYDTFNEEFRGWYLEHVYNLALAWARQRDQSIGRVRLVRRAAGTCYSIHRDDERRLHMALYTNPQALFFVEADGFPDTFMTHHIPSDGRLYLVDTTRRHTFMNGGRTDRTHLMLEVV